MARYSVQPRIFAKGYGFLSFAKIMGKIIGDLIGNKIANRITKKSTNSETVTNEYDKELPKERYIYISKKNNWQKKIVYNLRQNKTV